MSALAIASLVAACTPPVCLAPLDGFVVQYEHVGRDVDLRVSDGVATMTIRDRLAREAPDDAPDDAPPDDAARPGEPAALSYEIPLRGGEATVVDARVEAGSLVVPSRLDDPVAAAAAFEAFAAALVHGDERPVAGPLAPGVLVEERGDGVVVRVAGPAGIDELVVTLTVQVSSRYATSALRFAVPVPPEPIAPRVRVRGAGIAAVRLDGRTVAPGTWASIASAAARVDDGGAGALDEALAIVEVVHEGARVRGRSARATIGDVALVRAELELPAPLTTTPPALSFVFVLDRSVSVGRAALIDGAALARRVLAAAPPGSSYAAIAFARRPAVVVPAWTAADAPAALQEAVATLDVENGSDLRAALALAGRIAGDAPADAVRVIVVSDVATPDGAFVTDASSDGPLRHVVQVPPTRAMLPRCGQGCSFARVFTDEDAAAHLAERTGGILVSYRADPTAGPDADDDALALHLVRPTRIDRSRLVVGEDVGVGGVSVDGLGASDLRALRVVVGDDDAGSEWPETLHEGVGVRAQLMIDAARTRAGGALRVSGLAWASPIEVPLPRSRASSWALRALSSTGPLAGAMTDGELRAVATAAGAVSRVTARVGLPTWRPARDVQGGWGASYGCGCGGCGTFGSGSSCRMRVGTSRSQDDAAARALLTGWLLEDAVACAAPAGARLEAELDIGHREIRAVAVRIDGAAPAVEACVVDRGYGRRVDRVTGEAGGWFDSQRVWEIDARMVDVDSVSED